MYSPAEIETHQDYIIEQLRYNRAISDICKDPNMPHVDTVYQWLNKDKLFSEKYVHAKEIGFILKGYEMLELADNADQSREAIQKAALQIDTRKWLLSKLLPKKFGKDKADINVNIQPVEGMTIIDVPSEDITES